MPTCRICHRPLSNPESIRLGIGPVCRGRDALQETLFDDEEKSHIVSGSFDGDVILSRSPDGRPVVNIEQIETYHSPTGFEWGYGGSGPADLALNILLKCVSRETAFRLHQEFKLDFIAALPNKGGVIQGTKILEWVAERV